MINLLLGDGLLVYREKVGYNPPPRPSAGSWKSIKIFGCMTSRYRLDAVGIFLEINGQNDNNLMNGTKVSVT